MSEKSGSEIYREKINEVRKLTLYSQEEMDEVKSSTQRLDFIRGIVFGAMIALFLIEMFKHFFPIQFSQWVNM